MYHLILLVHVHIPLDIISTCTHITLDISTCTHIPLDITTCTNEPLDIISTCTYTT